VVISNNIIEGFASTAKGNLFATLPGYEPPPGFDGYERCGIHT